MAPVSSQHPVPNLSPGRVSALDEDGVPTRRVRQIRFKKFSLSDSFVAVPPRSTHRLKGRLRPLLKKVVKQPRRRCVLEEILCEAGLRFYITVFRFFLRGIVAVNNET